VGVGCLDGAGLGDGCGWVDAPTLMYGVAWVEGVNAVGCGSDKLALQLIEPVWVGGPGCVGFPVCLDGPAPDCVD